VLTGVTRVRASVRESVRVRARVRVKVRVRYVATSSASGTLMLTGVVASCGICSVLCYCYGPVSAVFASRWPRVSASERHSVERQRHLLSVWALITSA
jgi:hypothetical protein